MSDCKVKLAMAYQLDYKVVVTMIGAALTLAARGSVQGGRSKSKLSSCIVCCVSVHFLNKQTSPSRISFFRCSQDSYFGTLAKVSLS